MGQKSANCNDMEKVSMEDFQKNFNKLNARSAVNHLQYFLSGENVNCEQFLRSIEQHPEIKKICALLKTKKEFVERVKFHLRTVTAKMYGYADIILNFQEKEVPPRGIIIDAITQCNFENPEQIKDLYRHLSQISKFLLDDCYKTVVN